MDKLIEYGMWPLAVVMVAVVSLGMFRTPIAGAINRIRKIGGGDKAIEISDMPSAERQQQQVQSAPPKEIANHSLGPPTEPIADVERAVVERLATFSESDDARISGSSAALLSFSCRKSSKRSIGLSLARNSTCFCTRMRAV